MDSTQQRLAARFRSHFGIPADEPRPLRFNTWSNGDVRVHDITTNTWADIDPRTLKIKRAVNFE